jgi:apolipoprotein N-acyltransferase
MIRLLWLLLLGGITVFGFAPHRIWWLPFLTLGWLFARVLRAETIKRAALEGFAFGLGLFGVGASWVFVALNTFGQMHAVLAGIATFLFCGYLALFPMAAMALTRWVSHGVGAYAPFFAAAFFVAFEWLRCHLFTGFPWLTMDHAQAADSPLIGFAPMMGGLGVSLLVCFIAALMAWAWPRALIPNVRKSFAAGILIAALLIGGQSARNIAWTQATKSPPLAISLIQGNIAQDLKFRPEALQANEDVFDSLFVKSQGTLVIMPETVYVTPLRANPSEAVQAKWNALARAKNKSIIFGAPEIDSSNAYFNSAFAFDGNAIQTYRKHHLVPFGEYMPLKEWLGWFYNNVAIPLAGFSVGASAPAPLALAGEQLGVSICYEDVFARSIRPQSLDATLLVNLTNDAWYGRSWAAEQHAQIAQMRAAEFARPMVRATNTGITVAIDHRGNETARLPWFTRGILEVNVQGRAGLTPYGAMGDLPMILVLLAMLCIGVARALQTRSYSL